MSWPSNSSAADATRSSTVQRRSRSSVDSTRPRLLTNVVDVDPASVIIGMRVVLAPERHGDIGLPLFRPAGGLGR